ncbi:MAG: hypothetical protein AAGC95_02710 [Pseudomonadota bacterium]
MSGKDIRLGEEDPKGAHDALSRIGRAAFDAGSLLLIVVGAVFLAGIVLFALPLTLIASALVGWMERFGARRAKRPAKGWRSITPA